MGGHAHPVMNILRNEQIYEEKKFFFSKVNSQTNYKAKATIERH